jgi:hypothetical protein
MGPAAAPTSDLGLGRDGARLARVERLELGEVEPEPNRVPHGLGPCVVTVV